LRERTEQLIAREKAEEATWTEPTANDRLASAFEELGRRGLLGMMFAGLTIHDGWSVAALEAKPDHRGAVFFHQEDVLDALLGDEEFLLAFGAFEADAAKFDAASAEGRPRGRRSAAAVLRLPSDLEAALLGSASGSSRFKWRHRRWSPSPTGQPTGPGGRCRSAGSSSGASAGKAQAQFEDEMEDDSTPGRIEGIR
jgi:hypothetical protein